MDYTIGWARKIKKKFITIQQKSSELEREKKVYKR